MGVAYLTTAVVNSTLLARDFVREAQISLPK
jgi:hypothetical protein